LQLSAFGGDRSGSIGEFRIFVIGRKTGKSGKVYRTGKVFNSQRRIPNPDSGLKRQEGIPGGALSGDIRPVPEPGTLGVLIGGVLCLIARRFYRGKGF
jgi:hypothetical protein